MAILKKVLAKELQYNGPVDHLVDAVRWSLWEPLTFKQGLLAFKDIKHMVGHFHIEDLDANDPEDADELGGWPLGLRCRDVIPASDPLYFRFATTEVGSAVRGSWDINPGLVNINSTVAGASFVEKFLRRASERLGPESGAQIVSIKG